MSSPWTADLQEPAHGGNGLLSMREGPGVRTRSNPVCGEGSTPNWRKNLGSRFANWGGGDVLMEKSRRGLYLSSFRCMRRLPFSWSRVGR